MFLVATLEALIHCQGAEHDEWVKYLCFGVMGKLRRS
jgi:hypothetical protein